MPSILINFGEERKVYDIPDQPVPWQKVVNVAVGEAPTVDVFFKSATQEVRVKTFKFKTQKDRHVTVTVALDATNTVTAKLITLDPDTDKKDGEIVVFDTDGTCDVYTRTSQNTFGTHSSTSWSDNVEGLQTSARSMAATVPSSRATAAFAVAPTSHSIRRRTLEVAKAVGYKDIHFVDMRSLLLSSALYATKPSIHVGELIGICLCYDDLVSIVRKTERGYDCVETWTGQWLYLFRPDVKQVIVYNINNNIPTDRKDVYKRLHAPFLLKFVIVDIGFKSRYLWNHVDGGNLDGYFVTPTTQCTFRIKYKDKDTVIDAMFERFPWQKTVKLDIGEAPTVNVYFTYQFSACEEEHVKQFKFTSKKSRKVSISIAIDNARLPEVKLTTL